jgi:hypothetical protein
VSEVVTEVVDGSGADELLFTPRAQRALERAGRFARRDRAAEVDADHVLLGVLDVDGLACQVLRGLGVDVTRLRSALVPPEPDAAPVVEAQPEQAASPVVRPRCPGCGADLDESLAETDVAARRDGETATTVSVVYCLSCGVTLGALAPGRRRSTTTGSGAT